MKHDTSLDEAKQLLYAIEREEHSDSLLIRSKPAEPNVTGEQPIRPRESAPDTAGIPPEGFNGF